MISLWSVFVLATRRIFCEQSEQEFGRERGCIDLYEEGDQFIAAIKDALFLRKF